MQFLFATIIPENGEPKNFFKCKLQFNDNLLEVRYFHWNGDFRGKAVFDMSQGYTLQTKAHDPDKCKPQHIRDEESLDRLALKRQFQ